MLRVLITDQVTRNCCPLCFRRYAMKPTPINPRIIIAHVEGSGTAAEMVTIEPFLPVKVSPATALILNPLSA